MGLRKFDYFAPLSVPEACAALAKHPDDAKLIAGGQSLLRMMKYRMLSPSLLVDLKAVPGLTYVTDGKEGLRIGALATHTQVIETREVREHYSVLADAEAEVSTAAVRNWGTLVGNLCVGHTSSDSSPALLVLDASVAISGPDANRVLSLGQFFKGHLTTDLSPSEVVTEIRVPRPPVGSGMAYLSYTGRQAMETPLVSVAALIVIENGRCAHARIALAGAAETAFRSHGAERALVGKKIDAESSVSAGRIAQQEASPDTDVYGSSEYRRRLVGIYVRDAVQLAASRAAGSR